MKNSEAAPADPLGSTVLHRIEGGVSRITLNKPDAANALSPDQRNLIIQLLADADADLAVRAVVIEANGRHFCSGADLRRVGSALGEVRATGSSMRTMLHGTQSLFAAILDCGKPIIAAVQGPAAGLGAHLAFACDLVIAAETAYFFEPFALRGIALDAAGAYLLPRRMGLQKAKELVFLGDRLTASEARDLGLVNAVHPDAELKGAVTHLAARLAGAATLSIMLAKKLLNASLDGDRPAAFLAEAMAQEIAGYSDDAREGVAAFIEKRQPNFMGR
jgi:2-(1,2-epoxy-1,2-dihydrophenyl)acetyl-CoA isomerase